MPSFRIVLLALLALSLLVDGPLRSGAGLQSAAAQVQLTDSVGTTETMVGQTPSGLPVRPPDPRTLREFWPVFVGFAVTWVGLVGYLLTFGGRMKRVGEAMKSLEARTPGGRR
jgi:CcmD family protein